MPSIIVGCINSHCPTIESCRHCEWLYDGTHFINTFNKRVAENRGTNRLPVTVEIKARVDAKRVDSACFRVDDNASCLLRIPGISYFFELPFEEKLNGWFNGCNNVPRMSCIFIFKDINIRKNQDAGHPGDVVTTIEPSVQ